MKPEIKIENWYFASTTDGRKALCGEVSEHPKLTMYMGIDHFIQTSLVLKFEPENNFVETKNSIYILGKMHKDNLIVEGFNCMHLKDYESSPDFGKTKPKRDEVEIWNAGHKAGYIEALHDYGIWKSGVQHIGCLETPVKEIIQKKFGETT